MDILEAIKKEENNVVSFLSDIIKIRSILSEKVVDGANEFPFGLDIHKCFETFLNKAEVDGFTIKNVDNYGGHIDFAGTENKVIGIPVHLDVVPVQNDWGTDPFTLVQQDGKLFGRGTVDNKGPAAAVYYALKILKENGFTPRYTYRMILGLDEETNWDGIEYYKEKVKSPDYCFVPDAEFPCVFAEKGILGFKLAKKIKKSANEKVEITSIKGGTAMNAVAGEASAIIKGLKQDFLKKKVEEFNKRFDSAVLRCVASGKNLKIEAVGKAAHASTPEKGTCAISILLKFLWMINVDDAIADVLEFYNDNINSKTDGSDFGINFNDDISGDLTMNVGMIKYDKKIFEVTIDVRYPVTFTDNDVYEKILEKIKDTEIGVVKLLHKMPLHQNLDSPFVRTLIDTYRQITGDDTKPISIGGGTYARGFSNAVAFGPREKNEESVEHQTNEYIKKEKLFKLINIYANAIINIDKTDL